MDFDLSVVISVNNEEKNIEILYARLKEVLQVIDRTYEVIFVEDGSNDNSYAELCDIYKNDPSVNVIKLNKNFGQTIGLLVGMSFVRSGIIITMDGDLQHDPKDILKFLEKIDIGFDLVNGKKTKRTDSHFIKKSLSLITKRFVCLLFGLEYYDINSTFRAYRYRIVHDMRNKGEMFRFLPLIAKAKGISFCEVDISCKKRRFGKTHFHLIGRLKRLTKDLLLLLSIKDEQRIKKEIKLDHLVSESRFHLGEERINA